MVKPVSPPLCPYCGGDAVLVRGDVIYPQRFELHDKRFWYCAGDQAWTGCHGKTERPLGTLADKALRDARQAAHSEFDPLWQRKMEREGTEKFRARAHGYRWLAEQMQLPVSQTHIAMFNLEQCAEVVRVCAPFARRLRMRR